jgi:hypothetical protein
MRKRCPALVFTALAVVAACSDVSSDPPIDCDSLTGQHFIVMQPPATGSIYDYTINVGDSIRFIGTVHRVNGATAAFDQLGGWSCAITGSSPVPGVVTFTTNDTERVRINADNWVRGLSFGSATVIAASATPSATYDIDILVTSP